MRWVIVGAILMVLAATSAMGVPHINGVTSLQNPHGDLWAVLVAGSNSWSNYRHQADVCHAYQILHQHGVPDDHIIVMMYDDLANNPENPTPGVVINRPGGPNVYEGVPIDYSGKDVTPSNFLKVLHGDGDGLRGVGTGRVLHTGLNDRVFINMVDHGAPGLFAFPDDLLNATDFSEVLLYMHRNAMYREMVIYVESCESGSLFKDLLPNDIEVYALSASSPYQHSYACYFDDKLETFLGDVFSVKWMEDTDRENLHKETLKAQYKLVRQEVNTSTVMHWGELKMGHEKLSRYLGRKRPHTHASPPPPKYSSYNDPCLNSSVPSPHVPIAILEAKKRNAKTDNERQYWQEQLNTLLENRTALKMAMWELAKAVTGEEKKATHMLSKRHEHDIVHWSCYLDSVHILHTKCFSLTENTYGLRLLHTLINLCEHGYTADQVMQAAESVCPVEVSNAV